MFFRHQRPGEGPKKGEAVSFASEFKEFIEQGDAMDLAVGVIIGGAFGSIVTSLVDDIISPIIGMALGGIDFSSLAVTVGTANLTYGNFIMAIINFLIIALVIFTMVRSMNKLHKKEEAVAPTCPHCLEEVKEGATKCPHCGGAIK